MIKLTKMGWDRAFKKEGKIFVKPHKDIPRVVKSFKKVGVKRVLDLGCGSGRHLVYLAKHGFEVYGIDIAKHGIKIAKDWLKKEGLKANLKISDFYKKLPYKDDSFDAIISIAALHHGKIWDIRKLIKEMKRVLKPKGLIFVTAHKMRPKKKIPKDKLFGIKYIAHRTYVILGGPEKGVPHHIFTKKELKKLFANFEILNIYTTGKDKIQTPSLHYTMFAKLKEFNDLSKYL